MWLSRLYVAVWCRTEHILLVPIPNSTNYIFEYNRYVGGMENDGYITEFAIVSNKEKDTILNYWDDLQDKHETQFEIDYMNSIQKDKRFIEEQKHEEEM